MPAVATQQLATTADLDIHGPPVAALSMFNTTQKDAHLRRASGEVLAAYGKRMTLPLVEWGDFTIGLTVDIAAYRMMVRRGFNPEDKRDLKIAENYETAREILSEISDLQNANARIDPDAVDSTEGVDEFGVLSHSEGGDIDEADAWARIPVRVDA